MRALIKAELDQIVEDFIDVLGPLREMLQPFLDLYNTVFGLIKDVKEAFQLLRKM